MTPPRNWHRRRPLFATPARSAPVPKQSSKWRWRYVLWNALKRTCMAIGAMVLLSALIGYFVASRALKDADKPAALPDEMVLIMPLEEDYVDHHEVASLNITASSPTMREVVDALDAARSDDRVKGVVANLRGAGIGMAHLYELRTAIKRFRESGKFAYFYVSSFAEQGRGAGSYYLASAFDEIWMQPVGTLSLPGVKAEMPFARGLLEKLGVTPQFFARKEYKNVFESFAADGMSEPTREMMTALVGDIADHMRTEIATDRGMTEAELQGLIDRALLLDEEALEAGLIDRLGYGDALTEKIKQDVTGDPEDEDLKFVTIGGYARDVSHKRQQRSLPGRKARVALVYAMGTIVSYSERQAGVISAAHMGTTLEEAIDNDNIEVIVIRLDSPGGSPVASETLRYKILRAQEEGKQVIISMGDAAASGGYWLAAPADYIFATPLTLTGSIGVAGGKFVIDDMWDKIGVNWDSVQWGENAGILSPNQPFNAEQTARYNMLMDDIYNDFITRVSEGRDMPPTMADSVARGRVWTGGQGRELGLVDEIGGLDSALDYAARLVGETDRHALRLLILPEPQTPFERLMALLDMQAGMGEWIDVMMGKTDLMTQAGHLSVYEPVRIQ